MGEMRNAYKILVRKPEGKKLIGRRRCRCDVNIRTDLREAGWEVVIGFIWFRRTSGRLL
jgi:hypothetical protein